jgi:hypothetical protein
MTINHEGQNMKLNSLASSSNSNNHNSPDTLCSPSDDKQSVSFAKPDIYHNQEQNKVKKGKIPHVIVLTRNIHKAAELIQYFTHIGLHPIHLNHIDFDFALSNPLQFMIDEYQRLSSQIDTDNAQKIQSVMDNIQSIIENNEDYILVQEQTSLVAIATGQKATLEHFEDVVHQSIIKLVECFHGVKKTHHFSASVEGFVFPNLKTKRTDVYNWDDIFMPKRTMKTYQEMKDRGVKNSARNLAMARMIEALPAIFHFDEKVNLNFNPVNHDEVISFEPVIYQLFKDNPYYKIAYENSFFHHIINHVLNHGLFIRRASNRQQKNYWLPGLNAGFPLTPKKDALHELTFMFHDLMHFLFPDLVVTDDSEMGRNKYLIVRMMSEAFTLVIADMFFIALLKQSGVEYDFAKRKIYPLFSLFEFDIEKDNLDKMKPVLWASTLFALLGDDSGYRNLIESYYREHGILSEMVESDAPELGSIDSYPLYEELENYKQRYQRFFQEDYLWTFHNYEHLSQKDSVEQMASNNANENQREGEVQHLNGQTHGTRVGYKITQNLRWFRDISSRVPLDLQDTQDFCPHLHSELPLKEQIYSIFEHQFEKLKRIVHTEQDYNPTLAFTQALRHYFAGQLHIFYRFDTLYNEVFLNQITHILAQKTLNDDYLKEMQTLYGAYIDKLVEDNFLTSYEARNYKNIYPVFEPFYVFYDRKNNNNQNEHQTMSFEDVVHMVFKKQ